MEIINVNKPSIQVEQNGEIKNMFFDYYIRSVDADIFKEMEALGYNVCYYKGKVDYDTFGKKVKHTALFLK